MRIALTLFVAISVSILAGLAVAQNPDASTDVQEEAATESDAETTQEASTDDESADDGDEADALGDLDNPEYADLDEQTYEEDDDDFVPTEEVPADEAIPFPSDI